ncbi:MAG: sialate O-acetylesterase [Verrucomicrobiota bacterium]
MLPALFSPAKADVFTNVPEAAEFNVAYELDIPLTGAFQGAVPVPYSTDNSATAAPVGFDRVAYYLELTSASGTTWAYASMDPFTSTVAQTGLPHAVNNPVSFQTSVSNLTVLSNVAGVKNGSFDRGQIEMWHQNYTGPNGTAVFAAGSGFDWGDTLGSTSSGYGSFQVHNPGAKQTIFAYNRWAQGTADDDIGIGNATGTDSDWTLKSNAASYLTRKLVVLVRPKRFNVTFTNVPVNQQVIPRNVATNLASVTVSGTESSGGFEKAVLEVFRNGAAYETDQEAILSYSNGTAAFSFTPTIAAELASFTFELYLEKNGARYLVRRITDVVAGDVYLWYGQSNAEAAVYSGNANTYASPWIRTFGMSDDDATNTMAYNFWVEANGNGSRLIPAGVGQWALVVARKIVNDYQIPVAVLNGARGGYSMPQLQRDDAATTDTLATLEDSGTTFRVYNRLRYRARQASVTAGVRGIFYYQGESDNNNAAQHLSGFASLMADWQEDYPGVERIFVSQLHVGCNTARSLPELRDAQRLLPDIYEKVRVIATNGITAHTDSCHFPFTGGYETHGLNSYRQVSRELYGAPDSPAIDSPNPASVELANAAGNKLRIVLRKPAAGVVVDPEALVDFRLTGSDAILLSASTTSSAIELQYDRPLIGASRLDYLAHGGNAPGWIRNANGVGMLTFMESFANPLPTINPVSPAGPMEAEAGAIIPLSATASAPGGTISRMEIHVNGILHTAVNSSTSISGTWTVPPSGTHQILFKASNPDGVTASAAVVILVGSTPFPAGDPTTLKVWLRPEKGIIRDSAGFVSAWQDSSGNSNHCTQDNAAARPVYTRQKFGTMPGVTFDGGDWLVGTAGMSTGSYTKVVRVSMPDFSSHNGNIVSANGTTGTRHALFTSGTASPRIWHNATFVTSSGTMSPNQGHVIVATYNGSTRSGVIYLDGVQTGTGTAAANNTDTGYQLGAIAGSNMMPGIIGEVIIFNKVLTTQERQNVEAYLAAKIVAPPNAALTSYSTWSATNIPSGSDAAVNGDANKNGIPNAAEFALGLDPMASGITPRVLDLELTDNRIDVVYPRSTDRSVQCQLFESFNLQDWQPVVETAGPTTMGIEERRFSRPIDPAIPAAFYKLQLIVPPP